MTSLRGLKITLHNFAGRLLEPKDSGELPREVVVVVAGADVVDIVVVVVVVVVPAKIPHVGVGVLLR